jgi:hypothetical protein
MDPLAELIRNKIRSGALPRAVEFVNTWYGRGTGRLCIACERPIAACDIEVEGDPGDGTALFFHGGGYRMWDIGRQRE